MQIGNYEIIEQLGAGAMGVVYKARHNRVRRNRMVALKLMNPSFTLDAELVERFQREIEVVGKLEHPNIVAVLDAGEHEGNPYLVMEYLEGAPLEKHIADAALTLDKKLEIMAAVCRGLDYAHKEGVVHRDVKPANIFVLADLTPKIVDFGVAHIADSTFTKAGMMIGTISYMSPEQLNGKRVDGRSDIFSAGIVLYHLVAGRLPFEGHDLASIMKKILMDPPRPLPDLLSGYPPQLESVLARALAKELQHRYQSAGEMAEDLEKTYRVISKNAQPSRQDSGLAETIPSRSVEPVVAKEVNASFKSSDQPLPEHEEIRQPPRFLRWKHWYVLVFLVFLGLLLNERWGYLRLAETQGTVFGGTIMVSAFLILTQTAKDRGYDRNASLPRKLLAIVVVIASTVVTWLLIAVSALIAMFLVNSIWPVSIASPGG